MKLSDMLVDTKAAQEGRWIGKKHGTPLEGFGDLCLKVKGMDTAEFRALQAAKIESLTDADRTESGKLTPAANARIYRECLDEAVLLGWQFMLDDDGAEVAYTPELQKMILMHDDAEPFRTAVFRASSIVGALKGKAEAIIAKN